MPPRFTPSRRGGRGTPLVCLHGFTDTWRTWELVLPALELHHDVLAPTLPGHAGGPPLIPPVAAGTILDTLEEMMDGAGFATAHLVGNSLGGYLALALAARGRARSVVALAPAGGWPAGDESWRETLAAQAMMAEGCQAAAPFAEAIAATNAGRRRATRLIVADPGHMSPGLVAHQIRGVAACATGPLIEGALRDGWPLDAERVSCPVRILWGSEDRLLPWPGAAKRFTDDWLPHADWVFLPGVGHCPQLEIPLETGQLILGVTAH